MRVLDDNKELPSVYSYRLSRISGFLGENSDDIRKDLQGSLKTVLLVDELVGKQKWKDIDYPQFQDQLHRQLSESTIAAHEKANERFQAIIDDLEYKENKIDAITWEDVPEHRKDFYRQMDRLKYN